MPAENHSKIVKIMNSAYELLARGNVNPGTVKKFIEHGDIILRRLRKLLRVCVCVREKLHLLTTIGQVECIKKKLEKLGKKGRLRRRERRSDRVRWKDLQTAFKKRIRTGLIVNLKHLDATGFFNDALALFRRRIENALKRENALKINAILTAEYCKLNSDGGEVIDTKYFNTANAAIFQSTHLVDWFNYHVREPILKDIEEFQERDSGWSLHSVTSLTINVNRYNPMRGSTFIDLPLSIKLKKACLNLKNPDNQCFKWAVLSALHPVDRSDNPYRLSKYQPYENELNFDGIEFPVMLKDVMKFENQNHPSVNVYILQKSKPEHFSVSPAHVTALKKDTHVNLLLIQNVYASEEGSESEESDDETPVKFHYVWIKDLSRLVSRQLSKKKTKKYICDRCLHYFGTNQKLQAHEADCSNLNKCKVTLPTSKDNILKFNNFKNKEKVPFIIYADFECFLKRPEHVQQQQPDAKPLKTSVYQIHEAFSIGYYLKCSYDNSLSRYNSYRGEKPAEWFVKELLQLVEDVETVFWCRIPMDPLSMEQERAFRFASTCHICEKPLLNEKIVRDHCHLTGRYRGPAHEHCNLNYQHSRTIPVVFHNLSGYDSHFIINEISTCFEGRVDVLPISMERYISFTKHLKGSDISLRFIDSFRFMASSLDELAGYLTELSIIKAEFPQFDDDQLKLLKRKGVFPYEFLDTRDKLEMVVELPTKDQFYSHLTDSTISNENYEHAKKVWSQFNITSLGEYSDLYLKIDVILLAEVFENFRFNCLQAYGLDPAHYYTTPGLTWDAMLKFTKIKLELLTDIDMMMFIERGIRGGINQCSNRYAKANNQYMDDFDPQEESKYLLYYDVNNLYGWAMTQYLPYAGFRWTDHEINWDVSDESPVGYILEVDLEYPECLHDAHRDLPLCPEQMKPPKARESKLLTTLYHKSRYILHYRNLKQAVRLGLKVVKIHRVLEFSQAPWLKRYIDLNTNMRKHARNEFEINLYKLMNNAVFGKTMENVRKRATIKLITKWGGRYGAEAVISKPNFHSLAIFSENFVGIKLSNTKVLLNKPIYVGLAVLDLSKTCMYDFHYGYIQREFQEDAKLLYTDTDSLIYEIKCPDVYKIMKRDVQYFDTSNYPTDNVFGMPQLNKKVVGLMKDECNGRIMTEFVGLRSKMYSVRVEGEDHLKKVTGVKAAVVQRTIGFNDYMECLHKSMIKERSQYIFRSKLHLVQTKRRTIVTIKMRFKKQVAKLLVMNLDEIVQ